MISAMTRRVGPVLLLALLLPAAAAGRPLPAKPAKVQIGRVTLGVSPGGQAAILVPVTYPIQLNGRKAPLDIALSRPQGENRHWKARVRLSAGRLRKPERRRRFTFVHRMTLWGMSPAEVDRGLRVRVTTPAPLDANRDGVTEAGSQDRSVQPLSAGQPDARICSSTEARRTRPGRRTTVALPACTSPVGWRVAQQPEHGSAHVEGGTLVYRSGARFTGTDSLVLSGGQQVRFTVGARGEPVVRALGDSVTAGFGYYSNGTPMTIGRLLGCRPPATSYDDACSSNSLVVSNQAAKVEYAPDYGLSNNISWAAQWANEHAVTDYANFAVSGSEPADWAPGGQLHDVTERIESEDPDYILLTMGANPLLSNMLFGFDNMGCAIYSQIVGGYSECIERAFGEVQLRERLASLYRDLVQHTSATIYLMQYHLSVPSSALAYSATQIAEMGALLNREIEAAAAEVAPQRLQVVAPPHFDVGIDISPVYPSNFSCSRLGYQVDGPSVQSTPTQDELEVLHPLSFCEGPAGGGPPWVISGDTGIHPSAAGYEQMASQLPPPSAG
jgi:lysophospholipase L1-like esterase